MQYQGFKKNFKLNLFSKSQSLIERMGRIVNWKTYVGNPNNPKQERNIWKIYSVGTKKYQETKAQIEIDPITIT